MALEHDGTTICCKSCPYSFSDSDDRVCRRFAPVVNFAYTNGIAVWPLVGDDCWCGEHPSLRAMDTQATNAPLTAKFQDMINDMLLRQGK